MIHTLLICLFDEQNDLPYLIQPTNPAPADRRGGSEWFLFFRGCYSWTYLGTGRAFSKQAVLLTMVVTLKDTYHVVTPLCKDSLFLMGIMVVIPLAR